MILSRYTLKNITAENIVIPNESLFELPEKVLQFGTGALLRGLPDYFIDKANRQGVFNGRIVVVKSTAHGDPSTFDKQDGLYTHCIRDLRNGQEVEENIINSSISRVLDANTEWKLVLDCAHNQNIQIIISNTTETGIKLVQEDILRHPPVSFPGKLLAFLYERFKAFGGSDRSGLVIVPTELIPDNGKRLESIVLELAHLNGLEDDFIEWLENSNHFCTTLVDCMVTRESHTSQLEDLKAELVYTDQLIILSEAYRLWVIEGNEAVKNCLSFAQVEETLVITPKIETYQELRFRLLNDALTLSFGLAFPAGCNTVSEAMKDENLTAFISNLLIEELAPSILSDMDQNSRQTVVNKVLDRFCNPYIQYQWTNIGIQYSTRMKHCVSTLLNYYKVHESAPELFTLGFATYLYYMKATVKVDGKYYGEVNGEKYLINDDQADVFFKRWNSLTVTTLVADALRDSAFWGAELNTLPGFQQAVTRNLNKIVQDSTRGKVNAFNFKKEVLA